MHAWQKWQLKCMHAPYACLHESCMHAACVWLATEDRWSLCMGLREWAELRLSSSICHKSVLTYKVAHVRVRVGVEPCFPAHATDACRLSLCPPSTRCQHHKGSPAPTITSEYINERPTLVMPEELHAPDKQTTASDSTGAKDTTADVGKA